MRLRSRIPKDHDAWRNEGHIAGRTYPKSEARGLCSSLASFSAAVIVGLEKSRLRQPKKNKMDGNESVNGF